MSLEEAIILDRFHITQLEYHLLRNTYDTIIEYKKCDQKYLKINPSSVHFLANN